LQQREFASEKEHGYRAVKHQQFVGTGYFDDVTQVIASGGASTTALSGSTEEEQFRAADPARLTSAPETMPDVAAEPAA
jgi:isocitrate lyase